MSVEENKRVIAKFMEAFSAQNTDAAIDLLHDDATWWVAGKPDEMPLAGTISKTELKRRVDTMLVTMKNGLAMKLLSIIGEGDQIAAEVESYGETPGGRIYNNQYHFMFRLRDGKIQEAKEYLDPLHLHTVFFKDLT